MIAGYIVFYSISAPCRMDADIEDKARRTTGRVDGVIGRKPLIEVKGFAHPSRHAPACELIDKLNARVPFLNNHLGNEETAFEFFKTEKIGTMIEGLRAIFKKRSCWWPEGFVFKDGHMVGIPSDWKPYLKAFSFPLAKDAYELINGRIFKSVTKKIKRRNKRTGKEDGSDDENDNEDEDEDDNEDED